MTPPVSTTAVFISFMSLMMETFTAMMWLQVIKDNIWVYFFVCQVFPFNILISVL